MQVYDTFNNQFKLYDYISNLNCNLLQYLDNNNINVNYYCFYSAIIDNKHHIITSTTTKRALNGHRYIVIKNVDKVNNIFEYDDNLIIIFDNIYIKVTCALDDMSDVTNRLGIAITPLIVSSKATNSTKSVVNQTINCFFSYDNNTVESDILYISNVMNLRDFLFLNNLKNLRNLTFSDGYNYILTTNVLPDTLQVPQIACYLKRFHSKN
jgi:hypothetical protein